MKDKWKIWIMVIINVFIVVLGYWGLIIIFWFLLFLFWVFIGIVLIGFFVIGYDCGYCFFVNCRWVNDLVGYLIFLFLIYFFYGW